MPYIKREDRKKYDGAIDYLLSALPEMNYHAAGDFTYIVYRLLKKFNDTYRERAMGIGCLTMVIQEMYRREHAAYEEAKRKEHGYV